MTPQSEFLVIAPVAAGRETALRALLDTGGYLTFAWLVPGLAFCLAFFAAYAKFLFALDRRTRLLFIVSGTVFLAGTVALEMFAGHRVSHFGYRDPTYILLSNFEEMLEIDRWAIANLDEVAAKVRAAYEAYDFQAAYGALYNFCTVTLSAARAVEMLIMPS